MNINTNFLETNRRVSIENENGQFTIKESMHSACAVLNVTGDKDLVWTLIEHFEPSANVTL